MKFEDLKKPWPLEFYGKLTLTQTHLHAIHTYVDAVVRAVYDQMREHYEAKLAAWIDPSCGCLRSPDVDRNTPCPECKPAPEWRLPDPPPGQQWHRDDWTQDMLPEGYRPLLASEIDDKKHPDIAWLPESGWRWRLENANDGWYAEDGGWLRTRRPLPAPVEYIPIGPEDVPPGSVVRVIGASWWKQVVGVRSENINVGGAGNLNWLELANNWEILRPGSSTWEPCKKIKP